MKKKNKGKKLLIGSAAVGAAYAGLSYLIHYEIFHRKATIPTRAFESNKDKIEGPPMPPDAREAWLKEQNFEEYTLQSDLDGCTLQGYYLPAETDSDKFAVCSHGYRSRGKREFRLMTKFYHDKGFNVLLIDHRASGESDGSRITFGKKESDDLMQWIDWVRTEKCANAQIVLHGVSMGAATVLMLSDRAELLPNVKFIVSDCSYTSVVDEFTGVLQKAHIPHRVLIAGVDTVNRIASGFSLRTVTPIECVKHAVVPILFIHGMSDTFVPTQMSRDNYAACTSEKALLLVDGAAHASSYPTDSAAYEAMLEKFMDKYLDAEPAAV
jgi:hypothetical protein